MKQFFYKKLLAFTAILFLIYQSSSATEQFPEDINTTKILIAEKEKLLQKNSQNVELLKTLGILYHNLSRMGERNVADKAIEYLTKYNTLTKNQDAEAIAYLGSSYTLKGRDAGIPTQKIAYVKKGCKILDEAIKVDGNNIVARMVRANNSLSLPGFFNRLKYTEEDCMFLLNLHKKEKIKLNNETLSEIYFLLGEFYYQKNNLSKAKEFWQQSIDMSSTTTSAQYAKERLKKFK